MKGRNIFSHLIILVLTFGIISFFPALAIAQEANPPGFASCTDPSGSVTADHPDGDHAVAGNSGAFGGRDTVYTQGGNNALQCLCTGSSGMQTTWWNASDLSVGEIQSFTSQGWVYIPDGSQWGLTDAPYLAFNSSYSCGGNVQGTNSSSNGGGNPGAPVCTDSAPGGAPVLTSVIANGNNSVTLTWTPAPDPVTYYLVAYGTKPGVYSFGNPNVGGKETTSYTVNGLSGGVTYYFVVRAGNGCTPGPFSNELTSAPTGGAVAGLPVGFAAGVLGLTAPSPTPPASPTAGGQVEGSLAIATVCGRCFWWPILVAEILVLVAVFYYRREDKSFSRRLVFGGLVAVLAYVIFLLLNRNCPDGVMNLILITLPCRLFWLLAALAWGLIAVLSRLGKKE